MNVGELLSVLVRTNEHANRELYRVLADSPPELLTRAGGYFESIVGTLNHILVSELGWLNRLRGSAVHRKALDSDTLDFERSGFGRPLITDFARLRERREQVDAAFRLYVDQLDEKALATKVEQKTRDGSVRRQTTAFVLLHLMNHATHHRGQISQVLDEAGIEHDFSGILQAMRTWENAG